MTISPSDVRANGYSLRGYLAVYRGALVLTATVTADAAAKSAKTLAISITVGSIGDVMRGYRVQVFSAGGDFKGETNVRASGTLDVTHLPVREFSQSEFLIGTGDVVKVYALVAFVDKLVEDTDLFDPDGLPVGTFNSAPPPLAGSGGLRPRFVDGYETATPLTYGTVQTDGSASRILDPTSNLTHIAHLWTLPAGVAFAPGSGATDESPTLRVNVGEYTIYHDVTDTDNGQTWRQCVNQQVFDAAHPPVSVIMETAPTGEAERGWSCTFRAVDFLSLAASPDGSLVAFFTRERINGAWVNAVKLVGYLSHDESDLTPQLQLQRFEVLSPLARLSQLPGFSKVMLQSATPDDWSKASTALTTLRANVQLLRFYTFALDGNHDLIISFFYNLNDQHYPELWLQKETPFQQVMELADGIDCRLSCNRSGLFRLDPLLPLLDPAFRVALTTVYTYARRDVLQMVIRRDHFDTVETLELHATSATSTGDVAASQPYFSRAPGSPGRGADFITIERIITSETSPQTDTNARAGRRLALRNQVSVDSTTGLKLRAPEIEVELRLSYDFLDFDDQIVRFDAFPNPRDVDLTALDWWLTKVRLDYAASKVIHTFQPLTDAPPGASYFPPPSTLPPATTPPPPVLTVPDFPGLITSGAQRIALISMGGVSLTRNFQTLAVAGGPSYTAYAAPWSGTLLQWVPNGFDPGKGWIVTTTEVGYLTLSSGAYTVKHTFSPAIAFASAHASFAESGVFDLTFNDTSAGTQGLRSIDNITFTLSVINSNTDEPSGQPLGCYVSSKTAGRVVSGVFTGLFATVAYVSADHGATWAALSPAFAASLGGFANIHVPWAVNNDATYFYTVYVGAGNPDDIRLYRQMDGVNLEITPPAIGGYTYGPNTTRNVCETSVLNANRLLFVGEHSGGGWAVFLSNNALAAAPTYTLVEAPGTDARRIAQAGDTQNVAWGFGVNAFVKQYSILGDTVTGDDRSGDYDAGTYGEIIGFAGWQDE